VFLDLTHQVREVSFQTAFQRVSAKIATSQTDPKEVTYYGL
jgi:hypothetical protein